MSTISGAAFNLPEVRYCRQAEALLRRVGMYGFPRAGICPTQTGYVVFVPAESRDPAHELKNLRTFFPDLRWTYHDGQEIAPTSSTAGSPDWLATSH